MKGRGGSRVALRRQEWAKRGGGLVKTVIFVIFLCPLMDSRRHAGLLLKMLI
jgi:hypothetical protein